MLKYPNKNEVFARVCVYFLIDTMITNKETLNPSYLPVFCNYFFYFRSEVSDTNKFQELKMQLEWMSL